MTNQYYVAMSSPKLRGALAQDIPALQAAVAGAAVGANPTAKVGSTVVNGAAATFMRSDASAPIDLAAAYIWTAKHTFSPATAIVAVKINAAAGNYAFNINSTAATTIAASLFQQNSVNSAVIGSDGTQAIFTDSVNGDLCAGVASGGSVRLGVLGSTTGLKLTAGAATHAGPIGVNGNTPPAQSTGWGTATGGSVANNFSGAAATLPQATAAIAQIITVLKQLGFLGT